MTFDHSLDDDLGLPKKPGFCFVEVDDVPDGREILMCMEINRKMSEREDVRQA